MSLNSRHQSNKEEEDCGKPHGPDARVLVASSWEPLRPDMPPTRQQVSPIRQVSEGVADASSEICDVAKPGFFEKPGHPNALEGRGSTQNAHASTRVSRSSLLGDAASTNPHD